MVTLPRGALRGYTESGSKKNNEDVPFSGAGINVLGGLQSSAAIQKPG